MELKNTRQITSEDLVEKISRAFLEWQNSCICHHGSK